MKNKVKSESFKDVETLVNEWFLKTIHETIIQRDTELHAKFHLAKDELVKLLKANDQPTNEEIK